MRQGNNHTQFICHLTASVYLAFALLGFSSNGKAQSHASREYQVKAAFLYNFTKFVEWPDASFISAEAPFVIAILGDDPFGAFIDSTVIGEQVKGHPIIIQRYKLVKDIQPCHLLFITRKEVSIIKDKIPEFKPNILTVSDDPEFNKSGGMIRLKTIQNKIKFVINPSAVKAAQLDISSKLLNMAEIFVASS